jgi:DNA-binding CsgD family transcriptional regulator
MYLSDDKLGLVRELITKLYTQPFDEALILEAASFVCRLADANYLSFFVSSGKKQSRPLLITNDPHEHIPVYLSVAQEDFLLHSIVSDHQDCVLHCLPQSDPSWRGDQNFIHAVQSVRPISDTIYIPITIGDLFVGAWAVARAGLHSPLYSDNQLEVIRFIIAFLNDAFKRSLVPAPVEEDIAYLDYRGQVVQIGAKIKETFDTIFDGGFILEAKPCHDDLRKVVGDGYRRFVHGPFKVGMDRLTLHFRNRNYSFLFRLLRPSGVPLCLDGIPYGSVRILAEPLEQRAAQILDMEALSRTYGFTSRECEVIDGLFRGWSNKSIAHILGVDESTVKRHTHNIYEKSGFGSRVELVLGLRGANKIN